MDQKQEEISENKDSESSDIKFTPWNRGPKAPTKMQRGSSTVVGNVAYFSATMSSDTVYAFNCNTSQWSTLPKCPYGDFTLTNINAQLTTIGGWDVNSWPPTPTNKIFTYSSEDLKWVEQYPPMPTKRRNTVVIPTNTHVFVIGGNEGDHKVTAVEILDLESLQWSTASPIPHGIFCSTVSLCGETLYVTAFITGVVGPFGNNLFTCNVRELLQSACPPTASSSTESQAPLVSPTTHCTTKVWHIVSGVPFKRSTIVNVRGNLLSIGGRDEQDYKAKAQIFKFNSDTSEWIRVAGHMTMPRSSCMAEVLPGDHLFVVGGCDIGETDETEMCRIIVDL